MDVIRLYQIKELVQNHNKGAETMNGKLQFHLLESRIEAKLEAYTDYLVHLDREFLLYEFSDRMGCSPEEYFVRGSNSTSHEKIIATLIDAYDIALFDDINENWITSLGREKID